jgi:hypothetical protein
VTGLGQRNEDEETLLALHEEKKKNIQNKIAAEGEVL